jgi:large subunit ribosomal protein L13
VATEGLRFRLVDAKGQVVGRLASQIAQILMGKDKPTFCPWKDDGDVVVVVNAGKVEFTGARTLEAGAGGAGGGGRPPPKFTQIH